MLNGFPEKDSVNPKKIHTMKYFNVKVTRLGETKNCKYGQFRMNFFLKKFRAAFQKGSCKQGFF